MLFSNTDYIALIIAITALVSPILVEIIKNKSQLKRIQEDNIRNDKLDKKEVRKEEKKEQFQSVINYIISVNKLLKERNSNSSRSIEGKLFQEVQEKKIIAISHFYQQVYWEGVTGAKSGLDDFFQNIEQSPLESRLVNTIEYISSLVDNKNSGKDLSIEIKILLDVLARLLGDFYGNNNDETSIMKFIISQKEEYIKIISDSDNGTAQDYFIMSNEETVEDYYKRIFKEIEKLTEFNVDAIKGISGRLSFKDSVNWLHKVEIRVDKNQKSKNIFLNTGITNSEAVDTVRQIYYQIKYRLAKADSLQTVRQYVESNLKRLNDNKIELKELERSRKGSYLTDNRGNLSESMSDPLVFTDFNGKQWFVDMNLTKDEAYSILKNIVVGNQKYDRTL